MQVGKFENGNGHYVHGLIIGKARISAWFENDGTMIDAQRFDRLRRAYPVKKGAPLWKEIELRCHWIVAGVPEALWH